MKIVKLLLLLSLVTLSFLFFSSEDKVEVHPKLNKNDIVLAFGDSLTYGHGVDKSFSYPSVLAQKTSLHVANAGISGELSSTGLKRLPLVLKQHKPRLVILCHGGNDILRKLSHTTLKSNLIKMIKMIQKTGAEVLLIGVPSFGLLGINTVALYEEVAVEMNVMYEGEILSIVEAEAKFKSDRIHPNEIGYEMMADKFILVLKAHKVL